MKQEISFEDAVNELFGSTIGEALDEGVENAENAPDIEPMSEEAKMYHACIQNYFNKNEKFKFGQVWAKMKLELVDNNKEIIERLKANAPEPDDLDNYEVGKMWPGSRSIYLAGDLLELGFKKGDGYYKQLMCSVAKHEMLHHILDHGNLCEEYLVSRDIEIYKNYIHGNMNKLLDMHLSTYYNDRDLKVERNMKLYAVIARGFILEDAFKDPDTYGPEDRIEWGSVKNRNKTTSGLNPKYWTDMLGMSFEKAKDYLGSMLFEELADRHWNGKKLPEIPKPEIIAGEYKDPKTFVGKDGTVYGGN